VIPTLDDALPLEQTLVQSNIENSVQISLICGFIRGWGRKRCRKRIQIRQCFKLESIRSQIGRPMVRKIFYVLKLKYSVSIRIEPARCTKFCHRGKYLIRERSEGKLGLIINIDTGQMILDSENFV